MMSRLSSVVFGVLAVGTVAMTGCRVSVETENHYVDDQAVTREAPADWAGEEITIDDKAVGVSINGGLEIIADPSTTKVRAVARFVARAFSEDKALADQSIVEAKATFTITTSGNTTTVACAHGGTHGSSDSGESGCEKLTVYVPAGSADKPLVLKGLSGNGGIVVKAGNAYIKNLGLNSNGGDIDATVAATKGANISAVSEKADDVTIRVPSDFAADLITLNADAESIDTTAFPDVTSGSGRGTKGEGAAAIALTSKEFAGSTGKVILAK